MPGRKVPQAMRREAILRAAYDVAARHGVEALTVRAVAGRAAVSHGTVLFHFKRRDELVAALLDRVLDDTAVLRIPGHIARCAQTSEQLRATVGAEMQRLSAEPGHFRLFLEYWTLGVRNAAIRRKIRTAFDRYRAALSALALAAVDAQRDPRTRRRVGSPTRRRATAEAMAGVAVSVIHGCALQAVIDPAGFDVQQHVKAAARMLDLPLSSAAAT
jgi:AcrR family transcriptional regulator